MAKKANRWRDVLEATLVNKTKVKRRTAAARRRVDIAPFKIGRARGFVVRPVGANGVVRKQIGIYSNTQAARRAAKRECPGVRIRMVA